MRPKQAVGVIYHLGGPVYYGAEGGGRGNVGVDEKMFEVCNCNCNCSCRAGW